jgi:hypothetical protein
VNGLWVVGGVGGLGEGGWKEGGFRGGVAHPHLSRRPQPCAEPRSMATAMPGPLGEGFRGGVWRLGSRGWAQGW